MRRLDGDQAAMMNDVRDESRTHPRPFPLKDYRRLLILAPHPVQAPLCRWLAGFALSSLTALTMTLLNRYH